MKNLTIALPDDVYREARVHAAAHGTSLSRLVRDYLASLTAGDEEFARLEALQHQVLEEIRARGGGPPADEWLTRDEVHDRGRSREREERRGA